MPTAFEKLIADLDPELTVLDVGYGGLDGENTTTFLRTHFCRIEGLCKDATAVDKYQQDTQQKGDTADVVTIGIYPQDMPARKYDLLVLDPNIEGNLAFWSDEGMARAWKFVNDDGYIITYIMTTDFYGDEATQEKIKAHRAGWWANDLSLPIIQQEHEERRQYITWALLKKP